MNENNEVLEFIYKDANMGVESITTLLNTIKEKDNKIKNASEDALKDYEKYLKESKKLIHKNKLEVKEENMMAKASAWMGIKMELMKDNSDARIADMLIKGLTMGSIESSKKIDDYKDKIDKDILKLLKDFQKFQEDAINKLKKYL